MYQFYTNPKSALFLSASLLQVDLLLLKIRFNTILSALLLLDILLVHLFFGTILSVLLLRSKAILSFIFLSF